MKTWIILTALKLLAGISKEQWEQAKAFVKELASMPYDGPKKRALAVEGLKGVYESIADFAANLLVEAAVAWLKKNSK
jgi:hypothetical protein